MRGTATEVGIEFSSGSLNVFGQFEIATIHSLVNRLPTFVASGLMIGGDCVKGLQFFAISNDVVRQNLRVYAPILLEFAWGTFWRETAQKLNRVPVTKTRMILKTINQALKNLGNRKRRGHIHWPISIVARRGRAWKEKQEGEKRKDKTTRTGEKTEPRN
jgi:hypothetical protein